MRPLEKEALRAILTQPKNALIKQYETLFQLDGIELQFTSGALDFIVEKAVDFKLGARGLRSICEAIMIDAMFDGPSNESKKTFEVTLDYAKDKISKSKLHKLKAA